MAFKLMSSTGTEAAIELPITSLVVTSGDLLALAVGSATWAAGAATTEHWQLKAIATETVANTATVVKAMIVQPGQVWEVESANNSNATHNGDRMLLTDANTVNNAGTDNTSEEACFVQLGTLGATGDTRIFGVIVQGSGVNSDAN